MKRLYGALALAGVLGVLLAAGQAKASGFEVSPVALTFTDKVASGMISVTNRSPEPVRFQVKALAWSQKPDGQMVFTPSNEIVFFPAMLTLNPNEARNVRVGITVAPGAIEKTYRVFVQELPRLSLSSSDNGSTVGVLSNMAIPVFLAPATPKVTPSLSQPTIEGATVKFSLRNTGNVHFRPDNVVLVAKDGQTVLHTAELSTWYVLAGGTRDYVATLPPQACVAAKSIEVELKSERGNVKAALPNVTCTP